MLVYGDELRPMLEQHIGPIDPNTQTLARVVDGQPVCIVSFGNLRRGDVEIMGWARPGGVDRGIIRALAEYAFVTLGVNRVSARAVMSNTDSQRILTRLGFRREGLLRRADDGEDVLIFGLLPEDLKHVRIAKATQTD